jgi:diacylglycerol kinase (ATP)
VDLEVKQTSPELTTSQLTQEAIRAGYQSIVASGGDGTVSQIANEMVGSEITLGMIPRGTANALAVCVYGNR